MALPGAAGDEEGGVLAHLLGPLPEPRDHRLHVGLLAGEEEPLGVLGPVGPGELLEHLRRVELGVDADGDVAHLGAEQGAELATDRVEPLGEDRAGSGTAREDEVDDHHLLSQHVGVEADRLALLGHQHRVGEPGAPLGVGVLARCGGGGARARRQQERHGDGQGPSGGHGRPPELAAVFCERAEARASTCLRSCSTSGKPLRRTHCPAFPSPTRNMGGWSVMLGV